MVHFRSRIFPGVRLALLRLRLRLSVLSVRVWGIRLRRVWYDPGVYDQSNYYDQGGYNYNDQSNYYDQGGNTSTSYDQSTAVAVAEVQDQLATAGYYHGKIDGVLGPETRRALLRYQSDK